MFQDMKKRGKISITRDFENYNYTNDTVLVFIDDFVGTGE